MNNMLIALQITALGMGLVFAAILLLWWLMNLLTAITADKETSSSEDRAAGSAIADSYVEEDLKARAAAVAVAIALAEQEASSAHPLADAPTAIVSAWQLGMRTRQLSQKSTSIIRNPRKIG
jgi:Na+-transporting methylmalonyl-CoA/oxaloacetate decarboxylase gamma subunit